MMISGFQIHEAIFNSDPEIGHVFSNGLICGQDLDPRGVTMFDSTGLRAKRVAAINQGALLESVTRATRLYGCMMSFRSSLRDVVLPFQGNCLHDTWAALMLALFTKTRALSQPLMLYRTHPGQTVGYHKDQQTVLADKQGVVRNYLKGIDSNRETFELVLAQIQRNSGRLLRKDAEHYLAGVIAHLSARARLGKRLPTRFLTFATEFANANYLRYATKSTIVSDTKMCFSRPWFGP
jgi:hypothetical protein